MSFIRRFCLPGRQYDDSMSAFATLGAYLDHLLAERDQCHDVVTITWNKCDVVSEDCVILTSEPKTAKQGFLH